MYACMIFYICICINIYTHIDPYMCAIAMYPLACRAFLLCLLAEMDLTARPGRVRTLKHQTSSAPKICISLWKRRILIGNTI